MEPFAERLPKFLCEVLPCGKHHHVNLSYIPELPLKWKFRINSIQSTSQYVFQLNHNETSKKMKIKISNNKTNEIRGILFQFRENIIKGVIAISHL